MKSITCDGCGLVQTENERISDDAKILPSKIERKHISNNFFWGEMLMDLCSVCHKDLKDWLVRRAEYCKKESLSHGM